MVRALVLTVLGKDQRGLVAGHFAGVVQIHITEENADDLIASLPTLADRGLSVNVVDSDWSLAVVDHCEPLRLELVAQDRPGIVREISRTLAALGVSVQELRTIVESAPMSGERLFRGEAELVPSTRVGFEEIRAALEQLADDMVIDITLKTGKKT
jgi:glycine cleavage system regulatory protein